MRGARRVIGRSPAPAAYHVTASAGTAHARCGRYYCADGRRRAATSTARPLSCFCLLNKGASPTLDGERRVRARRHSSTTRGIERRTFESARRREVVDATITVPKHHPRRIECVGDNASRVCVCARARDACACVPVCIPADVTFQPSRATCEAVSR